MKKAEILSLLDTVIANCEREKESSEKAVDYMKLDIRKNTLVEVRDFLNEKLEDDKVEKETKKA